jgi:hypothetical protein
LLARLARALEQDAQAERQSENGNRLHETSLIHRKRPEPSGGYRTAPGRRLVRDCTIQRRHQKVLEGPFSSQRQTPCVG